MRELHGILLIIIQQVERKKDCNMEPMLEAYIALRCDHTSSRVRFIGWPPASGRQMASQ